MATGDILTCQKLAASNASVWDSTKIETQIYKYSCNRNVLQKCNKSLPYKHVTHA